MRGFVGRHRRSAAVGAIAVVAVAVSAVACTAGTVTTDNAVTTDEPTHTVRIVRTLAHDPTAFTQGLEVHDGRLIEGTGRSGQSRVTATADVGEGDEVARADLPAPLFGEGITVAGDTLWQITWQDGVAIARDPDTLAERRRVSYDGEGWGLCALETGELIMSDGTDTLTRRDPRTFEPVGTVTVTRTGSPVPNLNELECTPDGVYANVWQTDRIVRIDPTSGEVSDVIDASPLRAELGDATVDVLNGIAALPGTDRFLVTGKLWPTIFEVDFAES